MKIFSCVWLHFKKCFEKYFLVFSCILENTIENIFSACCSHFLTFSRLPKKYIISFIPQYRNTNKTQKNNHQIRSNPVTFSHSFSVAKQICNIIHFSIQKHRQNPEKKKKIIKSGQIERRRKRERRLGSTRGEIARWRRRSQLARRRDRDRRHHLSPFAHSQDRSFSLSFSLCASVSSLCVSQFRKSFEVKIETEMNFRGQRCFFKVN